MSRCDTTTTSALTVSRRAGGDDGLVLFVVGNRYKRIPDDLAPYDKKTGTIKKIHDVTIYGNVLSNNANII
jgi:hypothetical protein